MVQRFIEFYSWETPLVNPFNWKREKLKSRDRKLLNLHHSLATDCKFHPGSWFQLSSFLNPSSAILCTTVGLYPLCASVSYMDKSG